MPKIVRKDGWQTWMYNAGYESTKEWLEGKKVKQQTPSIRLLISPFLMPFVPVEISSADIDSLIINCSYQKSRSMPGGKFTIELAANDALLKKQVKGTVLESLWNSVGPSLRDIFKPMTYAQLWVDGYHVMSGYVRSFRKITTKKAQRYLATFDELGMLYQQNILDIFSILFGLEAHIFNDPTKLLKALQKMVGVPLAQVVQAYANAFIFSSLSYGTKGFPTNFWRASEGIPMALRLIALPPPVGAISNTSLLATAVSDISLLRTSGGGSFWDFLKSIASTPFLEMFTESGGRTICVGRTFAGVAGIGSGATISGIAASAGGLPVPGLNIAFLAPGFNYIVMRTTPFDNPMLGTSGWAPALYPWTMGVFDLLLAGDFVIFTDDDVFQKDLGTSDEQQYTIFRALDTIGAGSNDAAKLMNKPYISGGPLNPIAPGGIKTFGQRVFEASFNYNSMQWNGITGQVTEKSGLGTRFGIPFLKPSIHSLSTLLASWFRNNHKFIEGQVTIIPKPWARPGMLCLHLPPKSGSATVDPRELGMYYIDNVTYNYNYGKNPKMNLSLIRGTPIPTDFGNLTQLLFDWEVLPTGLNIVDGEP